MEGPAEGTIANSVFTANKVDSTVLPNGGAIKVQFGAKALIDDCTFIANEAYSGAAVDLQANTGMNPEVIIVGSTFKDNKAQAGAVASLSNVGEGTLTIINSTFENNTADVCGGAVYTDKSSKTTIIGTNFTANKAPEGAAVYALKDLTVKDSKFEDNAGDAGAAIFVAAKAVDATLTVSDSKFISNDVKQAGGAILLDASYGHAIAYDISGSEFTDNSAVNDAAGVCCAGGAVYMEGPAEGTIANSVFTANKVDSTVLPNGGAIKVQFGAKALIDDCTFIANEAYSGAAVDLQANTGMNPEVIIVGSTFKNNKAVGGAAVAALQNFGKSTASIENCTFEGNEAQAGDIYLDGTSTASISNSNFTSESVAIYNWGDLSLDKNTVSTVILNKGNITTPTFIKVLDNTTTETVSYGDLVLLYAEIVDDNNNTIIGKYNVSLMVEGDNAIITTTFNPDNNKYEANYTVLAAGEREVTAKLIGEGLLDNSVQIGILNVSRINVTEFTVSVEDIIEGQDAVVVVNLIGFNNTGITGDVEVIINNTKITISVVNGTGSEKVANLTHGSYPVVAEFAGNNDYYGAINSTVFYIKASTILTIDEIGDVEYGEPIEVIIHLTDKDGNNLTGVVVYVFDQYEVLIQDGTGVFTIDTQPDVGEYYVIASFKGNNDYNASERNITFKVVPKVINASEVEYKFEGDYDDGLNITIVSPVDTIYNVEIEDYGNVTVEVINGTGNVIVNITKPGDYDANITAADGNYSMDTIAYTFTYKGAPEFTVEISGTYPTAQIKIFGTPGDYHVDIDGFDTINITVSGFGLPGIAVIENINAGDHIALVSYDTNDKFHGDAKDFNFTIAKANVTLSVLANDIVEGETAIIEIFAVNDNLENINTTVVLTINDKAYGEITVNNGSAEVPVADLEQGKYNVNIVTADDNYNFASASWSFYVKHATSLVVITEPEHEYGTPVVIDVELNATSLSDVFVVSLTVNNESYNVVVENNVGQLKLTDLPAGNYTIASHFDGDNVNNYTEGNEVTFKVNPKVITLTVNATDCTVVDPVEISISTDSLFSGIVTITLNGEDYNITVINGEGGDMYTSLPAATYTVTAVLADNNNFVADEASATFVVSRLVANMTITTGDVVIDEPLEVNITLGFADGPVEVNVDGNIFIVNLEDGFANFTIPKENVTAGNHGIVAVFNQTDMYDGTFATHFFEVEKAENYTFEVNLTADEINYGENTTINVTLPEDANGRIVVSVDGQNVTYEDVVNGTATVTIPADAFKTGFDFIAVTYSDDKYGETTVEKGIYVNHLPSDLTASADNIELGENATIVIKLPTYKDGYVFVELLGKMYTPVDQWNVIIENLTEGTYTATVFFELDSVYKDNSTNVTFNVTKIVIPPEQAFNFTTPENSTHEVISVNLPEDATGFLLLDVNGTQTHVPLVDGKANVTVPNLPEGLYNATITYTGDNRYAPITTTKELNVTSNVPENALSIPDSAKSDTPTTYSISLPSDAGGYLEVDVDGTKYAAPLNNGSASVTIPALAPGNHNVTVKYTGDDKYTPVTKATTLNVTDPVYKISNNKNVAALYSAKATYKVLVLRDGKAAGAGEKVTFKFNGKTYTVKTDKNGYATLKLNTKVKVKKYTVTAKIKGASVKNTVTIKHVIKAKNKKIGKKSKKAKKSKKSKKSKYVKVKVSLKKVNGKYLKGKKITIKFKGKKYKVKTNKKGKATWKLKKSVVKKLKKGKKYKYTVTYGKDKVTKKIKVKK